MELWYNIKNFEGHYQISNEFRIRSLKYNKIFILKIKNGVSKKREKGNRYKYVTLCKDGVRFNINMHRLIAETFIPNPENKPYVNHKNGIRFDNRLSNLEWCSSRENIQHAYDTGLLIGKKGEKNPCAKITKTDAQEIRNKYKNGIKVNDIAKLYPIKPSYIYEILNGKTWKQ